MKKSLDYKFLIPFVMILIALVNAIATKDLSASLGWGAALGFLASSTLFRKEAKKQEAIAASRKRWGDLIDDAFCRLQKARGTVSYTVETGCGESLTFYIHDNLKELIRERGRVERLRAAVCLIKILSDVETGRPAFEIVQKAHKINTAARAALDETR